MGCELYQESVNYLGFMVRRDTPSVTNDTIINRIKKIPVSSVGGDFFVVLFGSFIGGFVTIIVGRLFGLVGYVIIRENRCYNGKES